MKFFRQKMTLMNIMEIILFRHRTYDKHQWSRRIVSLMPVYTKMETCFIIKHIGQRFMQMSTEIWEVYFKMHH